MTVELLENAISCIDDDLIVHHAALRCTLQAAADSRRAAARRRIRMLTATAACLCVATALAVAVPAALSGGLMPSATDCGTGEDPNGSTYGDITVAGATTTPPPDGEPSGGASTTPPTGSSAIRMTGTPITDSELAALQPMLTDAVTVLHEKGICTADDAPRALTAARYGHVTVMADGSLSYAQDRQNIPVVCADGTVVATVTLYRHSGELLCHLSYGGEDITRLNALLRQYAGQELLMLYLDGVTEAVLTPDGICHTLTGVDDALAASITEPERYCTSGNVLRSTMLSAP